MVDDADRCPGCGTKSYEQVSVSTVVCGTCRNIELTRADDDHKRKPGLHVVLKRRGYGDQPS